MNKLAQEHSAGSKADIVLIVLDTHRADRLGCNGYQRGTSPNLDAFARSATVFESAIAPAQWTIPSHASMFTGLAPSTHLVTQANSVLDEGFTTLAEVLTTAGYDTLGFCNNPLIGLIHNDICKGFRTFYNYSGTAPYIPHDFPEGSLFPAVRLWEGFSEAVRKFIDPIQNKFATSNELLLAATNPIFVPLWTRFVHFKGNTARSIRQTTRCLERKASASGRSAYMLFLNLMETHLPFLPPREYVQRFAGYVEEDPKAKAFMRTFNNQAMHWLIPLKRPFSDFEAKIISDMYDAEVAYQDHLLGELLEQLDKPAVRDNTLVVIVADHGEMLGEHQFMGHGFGVYKELIQVPLMIRLPGQREGLRIVEPVSTTRLFHTMLAAAGIGEVKQAERRLVETHPYSLENEMQNSRRAGIQGAVISEAYAPQDAVKMMERAEPELIERFHTRQTHRSIYSELYKLYSIEGIEDKLLSFDDQPLDVPGVLENREQTIRRLREEIEEFVRESRTGQSKGWTAPTTDISDPLIEQRLRDLGYMA